MVLPHDARKHPTAPIRHLLQAAAGEIKTFHYLAVLSPEGVSMLRCQRLQTLGLCLALGMLLSACDPKPSAGAAAPTSPTSPTAGASGTPGASPSSIKPADSGDKVDESTAHKGPSEGGAAIGGMSGPNGGGTSGGAAPAPSGGDGSAPK
ncbi:hypothetical protein FHT32_000476 [Variovorax sp. SG517]|uniref:hypothetical protein n=1 Tax=Variovorax sp. SG517 TaxID=2587117 RepID=UPI0018143BA4|nr:hypothetical protein [Variovorax sp. SG517]NVM86853.1 hypothetical protein [Variovorax sp. SG517]